MHGSLMHKDDLVYIDHLLFMSQKAVEAVQGKDRKDFDNNLTLQMGITHFIQVIGEAASRVSTGFQAAHSEIPWRQIIGTRHRIVHDYMNIDEDVVWEIVSTDLPLLVPQLERISSPK
jgi:uncharacterized protein with HEPN domain